MRIRTRYIPATDTQGSRIRAYFTGTDGREHQLTVPYDYASNDPHRDLASQIAQRPVWLSHDRQPARGHVFLTDD